MAESDLHLAEPYIQFYMLCCNCNFVYSFFEGLRFSSERLLNLDKIFHLHQAVFLIFQLF